MSRLHDDYNIILTLWLIRIEISGMAKRVTELFAGHPNLIHGINAFLPRGRQIECDDSNDPNAICATGHPVIRKSITLTQTAQGAGMNGVAPQQLGAAKIKVAAIKDAKLFNLLIIMHLCSTT